MHSAVSTAVGQVNISVLQREATEAGRELAHQRSSQEKAGDAPLTSECRRGPSPSKAGLSRKVCCEAAWGRGGGLQEGDRLLGIGAAPGDRNWGKNGKRPLLGGANSDSRQPRQGEGSI